MFVVSLSLSLRLCLFLFPCAVNFSNLFRRNSIAPKLLSIYALRVGRDYLVGLLKPLVSNICTTKKNLEVSYLSFCLCASNKLEFYHNALCL